MKPTKPKKGRVHSASASPAFDGSDCGLTYLEVDARGEILEYGGPAVADTLTCRKCKTIVSKEDPNYGGGALLKTRGSTGLTEEIAF